MVARFRFWMIRRRWQRYWSGERDPLVLFWDKLIEETLR